MKYLPILILILIQGFLFSCKKKDEPKIEYRLTPEDLSWNIYHEGDTIKFKSNLNHKLEYFVEYINQFISYPIPDSYPSYESIGIRFRRADSIFENNRFSMGLYRGYPGTGNCFQIMLFWHDNLLLPEQAIMPLDPKLDTLTVSGTLYVNILVMDNNINQNIQTAAKKIYYQKQKGWLRIELNSGEIYDRIN